MDGFKFNFDFNVNKSPLFELGNQLDTLAKRLDAIESQSKKLEDAFSRWRLPDFMAAFSGLSGVFSSIKSSMSWLVDNAAVKAAVSFASMAVDAARMREEALATFEAMYENKDVAANLFKSALEIAKDTKFETGEVVERFKALASGGYKSEELKNVFLAISDVNSAREGAGDRAQYSLIKMRLKGIADLETVNALAESGAGQDLFKKIADELGISGKKSPESRREEVFKLLSQKKVSDLTVESAFIDAVNDKLNGGKGVGHYSVEMGKKTLSGQISTLKSSLSDIFAGMSTDDKSGIGKFKNFLSNLNDNIGGIKLTKERQELNKSIKEGIALTEKQAEELKKLGGIDALNKQNAEVEVINQNSERFKTLVGKLVDDVFLLFDVNSGTTKDMFSKLLSIAEKLEPKFRSLMEWIKNTLLPFITDKVIPYIVGIFENPDGFLSGLKAALLDLARLVGKELYKGVKDAIFGEDDDEAEVTEYSGRGQPQPESDYGVPGPLDNMTDGLEKQAWTKANKVGVKIGEGVTDGTNKATDSHSPSRVFEKIGMNLVDGLDIGIKKGNSKIERSLSQLVEMPNDQQVMRTKDISIDNVSIHIDGAQEPNLIANEVIRVLKDIGRYSMAPNGLVR